MHWIYIMYFLQPALSRVAELEAQVARLTGSTPRFEACADGATVAANETGLLWERKTTSGDVHDVGNLYTLSSTSATADPDGTAYTVFFSELNAGTGFAGHTDWRLPTVSEFQTIMVGPAVTRTQDLIGNPGPPDPAMGTNPTGQSESCLVSPCVDPRFAVVAGQAAFRSHWAASGQDAWVVNFYYPDVPESWWKGKPGFFVYSRVRHGEAHVRAVRPGSCTN